MNYLDIFTGLHLKDFSVDFHSDIENKSPGWSTPIIGYLLQKGQNNFCPY